jgi:ribosomal protein S6--L-glutamate ligase
MKIGIVGNPGGWSTERLADVAEGRTGFRCVIDPAKVCLDLQEETAMFGDVDLCSLDGVIIKKVGYEYGQTHLDRLEVLRFINERGVPVFSRPERILRLLDRLACTVTLRAHDIPMPPTVITESIEEALATVRRFGTAVFKPLFSTKARGMRVIEDGEEAVDEVRDFKECGNDVMYIQRIIDLPGRDLGVVFLGGEYVGTYARVKNDDAWNTTRRAGGKYERYDPPGEIIELAERAQKPFGLDFTSVDVAESREGLVVFEVSAFGGFRGLKEGCGIDAAERYADYVITRIERERK